MIAPAIPADERERLAELASYDVLDSEAEQEFDDIAALAAHVLDTPIALVSLIDADRQWFKARIGLDVDQTPRSVSFCGHVVAHHEMVVVPDASKDERFADNPLVTGQPVVRFYAGAPLTSPSGRAVGTLCAIDHVPRIPTREQLDMLAALARQVMRLLELRRERRQLIGNFGDQAANFFRSALEMLCVARFDGYFERLNPSWSRTLGFSLQELMSRPFVEFVHVDDREMTIAEAGKLMAGGHETVTFDNRYMVKEGGYRWLRWTVSVNLQEERYYGVARDVTAEKRAVDEMRDSTARARAMFETATDGIVTVDARGVIETLNDAATRIFGHEAGAMIGRKLSELIAGFGLGEPAAGTSPNEPGLLGLVGARREVVGVRKGGERFPMDLALTEMNIAGDRMFTGMMRDISDRKVVEAMKNEFISTVSHELRTPLTSINGSLRLLGAGVAGDLPPEARELVEIASNNSLRLIRLVNDILDLEKSESGNVSVLLSELALDEVIQRSIAGVRGIARDLEVSVVDETTMHPTVRADADRLVQLLTNLLSNALKFSKPGGTVRVRCSITSSGNARVEVVDHGAGVPHGERDHVFERFHQVDRSDSRARGTGLGLAIAKALVELHEGRIGITDTDGGGATFWFEIPAIAAAGAAPTGDDRSGFADTLAGLRHGYRARLPDRAEELRNLMDSGDEAGLRQAVHRISGTAGSYGFPEISDAATNIDVNLKQGAPLTSLDSELRALIELLRAA